MYDLLKLMRGIISLIISGFGSFPSPSSPQAKTPESVGWINIFGSFSNVFKFTFVESESHHLEHSPAHPFVLQCELLLPQFLVQNISSHNIP